jgi:hypothetical protein
MSPASLLVAHLQGAPSGLNAQYLFDKLAGTIRTKNLEAIFGHFVPT